jgi:hypothetical protein
MSMSIVKIDQRAYGAIIYELTAKELPSSIRIEICLQVAVMHPWD